MKKILIVLSLLLVMLLCACKISISIPERSEELETPIPTIDTTSSPTVDATSSPTPEVTPSDEGPQPTATDEEAGLLGTVDGSTYINNAFGFSAAIPDGWQVATEEELSALFGVSSELMKETTGLEPGSESYIFYCSEYGASYQGISANINIVASNKQDTMALLMSESAFDDFIDVYKPMLEQLYGNPVEIRGETGVEMGGTAYSVIHISSEFAGTPIIQDQYFIARDDCALTITTTYIDESYRPVAEGFIKSIQYE